METHLRDTCSRALEAQVARPELGGRPGRASDLHPDGTYLEASDPAASGVIASPGCPLRFRGPGRKPAPPRPPGLHGLAGVAPRNVPHGDVMKITRGQPRRRRRGRGPRQGPACPRPPPGPRSLRVGEGLTAPALRSHARSPGTPPPAPSAGALQTLPREQNLRWG